MANSTATYDARQAEAKWYAWWEEQGFFRSTPDQREPYTIVIPPPNVTGVLHMGHLLNNTLQDVLIRRKRMEGYNACWVPGMDHASIATEAKVVAQLREQGLSKHDLGREQFLQHAWEWKEKYGGIILEQLKRLGCSCDWRRERFTMEEALSRSVIRVFVDLYEKGLVYRGLRMVNWDPQGLTALSDEEVNYQEVQGKLYYLKYQLEQGGELRIATTRPETILGDTAVAVHPEDERYKHLLGTHCRVPLTDRWIPIVADDYIDLEFGTGCLKVTPAHDENDYAIGQRHQLETLDILNADGTLNELGGPYAGMDRFDVRKQIAQDLQAAGLLEQVEDHTHKVGFSERTKAVVEPRLSKQWFVRMQDLAQPALQAVQEPGEDGVHFIPEKFINTYRHWMENIRDWTISRQLWWGHRIPAWYLPSGEVVVAPTPEQALEKARELGYTGPLDDLHQDEDVLDTWFSSWLWPITVFDGLEQPDNPDFRYYYPTSDLVTGPDIIFFWVARMIMAGYHYTGQRPFRHVYFTGLVRDDKGRKMSKSLGNSPDALNLLDDYGADGVRMGMLLAAPAGNDLLFDVSLCEQGKFFVNKLWNAWKLIDLLDRQRQEAGEQAPDEIQPLEAQAVDWMQARIAEVDVQVQQQYDRFRLSEVMMTVYKLIWDDFCSWYLELIKPAQGEYLSFAAREQTLDLFEQLLKQLHPFMPFITEELYQRLRQRDPADALIAARVYPHKSTPVTQQLVAEMDSVRKAVTTLRSFRQEKQLAGDLALPVLVRSQQADKLLMYSRLIERMAGAEPLQPTEQAPAQAASLLVDAHELLIPLEGLIDLEAEKTRIQEEIQYLEGFLKGVEKKLGNEKFVANAKPEIVEKERRKKADTLQKLETLRQNLERL